MKLAYFPGCSAKTTCPNSIIRSGWSGANLVWIWRNLRSPVALDRVSFRESNWELFLTLNARTLALAERLGRPVMTICATCVLNLIEVNNPRKDEALREDQRQSC